MEINGRDVRQFQTESLRSQIGVVPQKAALFRGTLRSNLLWGRADATDSELYEALDAAQAREFVDSKQQGLARSSALPSHVRWCESPLS